jgi:purine-nucleoside phosphorylase
MSQVVSYAALFEASRASPPCAALVLGSGLTDLAQKVVGARSAFFGDIPGLCATSVPGHRGCVRHGQWAGRSVLVFEGRLHYYEGHPWRQVVQPIHLARELGARVLIVTNSAGGIHEALGAGSLMAIRDHVEWTGPYPWRLPGPGGLGPPRPSPYSARLLALLARAADNIGLPLLAGVYAQMTGPCFDTPAEIRALRACGVDAVGMSTAREVQTACDLGMECAGLSAIGNRAAGLACGRISHDEVLRHGRDLAPLAGRLLDEFLRLLD